MRRSSLFCCILIAGLFMATAAPSFSAPQAIPTASKLERLLAPIKSKQDLERYLAITPEYKSPFSALTSAARRSFIDSLTFNESGLTGFSYRELQSELTPTQADKLLALFGARNTLVLMSPTRVVTSKDRSLLAGSGTMSPMMVCEDCDDPPLNPGGDGGGSAGGGTSGGGAGTGVPPIPDVDPGDTTDKDVQGYACVAKATCEIKNFSICRKGC